MRSLRCGWFVSLCFGVFTSFTLRADPAADAHPRVSMVADHRTLTFDQQPGPGGAQTVSVRSRSLVSVKPKEFLRLRVIVDPHAPVVYLSGLRYAWKTANAQLAARVLGVEAAHLAALTFNGQPRTESLRRGSVCENRSFSSTRQTSE